VETTKDVIASAHRARLCAHFGAHERARAHAADALEHLFISYLFEGMTEATMNRLCRYLRRFYYTGA
jgi:hypothetical protein